jgi:uncharacterized 2Fe-2S/4Fe-4S cluster protein (DUF4445 family)
MENRCEIPSWIRKVVPEINPPSLEDNTADVDRLIKGMRRELEDEDVFVDLSSDAALPRLLREYEYRVEAVVFRGCGGWHLIDILPLDKNQVIYGLAVDLGTSTVVIRLLDLIRKESVAETSFPNPQIEFGTDILTRIHYASHNSGLKILQSRLRDRINKETDQLAKTHGIPTNSIMGMSASGNTTMTHLFLGLDPYWICREPYIPVRNKPDLIRSKTLGLGIHPEAPVLVFPNAGSYFGGDLIAGILASGMTQRSETSILVDVGTNAEVVIGNGDWLMACAGAAGPALEGGVADMGMMAGPGVIDQVRIDPRSGEFILSTIDNYLPVGICGSGLIDLVSELFLAGMIDIRGKYVKAKCGNRLTEIDGIKHLIIVSTENSGTAQALTLSQPDIDALMRSKAAMYTILTTITNTVNIPLVEIRRFYISGTFGSYIDPRSAITIGMLPDRPLETYIPLGNTSLEGASMALLSSQDKEKIFRIRDQITYLELNVNQEFMNLYSAAKFIPHTDRNLFPTVKVGAA